MSGGGASPPARARVVVSDRTDADIDEQCLWIAAEQPVAALAFLDAVQATLERLAMFPESGRRRRLDDPALEGVRSVAVIGFPNHLVFHCIAGGDVVVIRVLHGARDLGRALGD